MNKKFLLALLAGTMMSAGVSFAAQPQTAPKAPENTAVEHFDRTQHKQMAEKMAKDLGLTEAQITKAEQLREESRKKIEPLMNQMGDLRQKIDEERRQNMEEFEKILTPEQKARFDQMRREGPQRFKGRMMRGMHQAPEDFNPHEPKGDMPEGEMLPPPDGEEGLAPCPMNCACTEARQAPKARKGNHGKRHAEKGGFIDD